MFKLWIIMGPPKNQKSTRARRAAARPLEPAYNLRGGAPGRDVCDGVGGQVGGRRGRCKR